MRATDDAVKEFILKKFFKFYQELSALKGSTDFTQKNNLKAVQSALIELIEQHSLGIQPYEGNENDMVYNEVLYLLTVFTDEMFVNIPWDGEKIWEASLLEEQLFQSHYSGNHFFELLENYLQSPVTETHGLSVLYLLILCLGFKGKYMHEDIEKKVNYYKKQLFISFYKSSPIILKEIKALFPEAYLHTFSGGIRLKFYNIKVWVLSLLLSASVIGVTTLIIIDQDVFNIELNNMQYFLYKNQLLIVSIIFILILMIILYTAWTMYRRRKLFQMVRKKVTRFEIKESLRLLSKVIHDEFSNKAARNEIPRFLIIGIEGAGSTTLIKTLKLKRVADSPFEEFSTSKSACNWYIFENGVFIDPASRMDEDISKPYMWKYFVRKLKKQQRLRPLDGIVFTVAYDDLVVPGNAQINNLAKMKTKTDKLYSKVLYVQKKLKMQLPVYIVVTKCDKMTGFEELVKKLPDEFRKNIFGWSSPYNTNVISYTKNWINEAFDNLGGRLTYLSFGLCIEDTAEPEFGKIMNLRYEFEGMKYPLQILTNKLFSICNNALLAPIIFRGIYFVGSKTSRAEEIESAEKAFLPDLVDKKIIREASLAKPVRKIIIY